MRGKKKSSEVKYKGLSDYRWSGLNNTFVIVIICSSLGSISTRACGRLSLSFACSLSVYRSLLHHSVTSSSTWSPRRFVPVVIYQTALDLLTARPTFCVYVQTTLNFFSMTFAQCSFYAIFLSYLHVCRCVNYRTHVIR